MWVTLREVWGTLGDVRDWSRDSRGGPVRVGGSSERSWMGRGTLGEVEDVFEDGPGGPGWVGAPSGRSKGPSGRSCTGQGTLGEVGTGRVILGEAQD